MKEKIKLLKEEINLQKNEETEGERRELGSLVKEIRAERFCEEVRKQLLACSMELIDCKAVLCQTTEGADKLYSLNIALNKN